MCCWSALRKQTIAGLTACAPDSKRQDLHTESQPANMEVNPSVKSPDSPTPAVMPVKAGKIIANTAKKSFVIKHCASVAKQIFPPKAVCAQDC